MKFAIRDLFLLTLVVAVSLGWWVDHQRAAKRDVEWETQFERALQLLSPHTREVLSFETPDGAWSVIPDDDTPRDDTGNPSADTAN